MEGTSREELRYVAKFQTCRLHVFWVGSNFEFRINSLQASTDGISSDPAVGPRRNATPDAGILNSIRRRYKEEVMGDQANEFENVVLSILVSCGTVVGPICAIFYLHPDSFLTFCGLAVGGAIAGSLTGLILYYALHWVIALAALWTLYGFYALAWRSALLRLIPLATAIALLRWKYFMIGYFKKREQKARGASAVVRAAPGVEPLYTERENEPAIMPSPSGAPSRLPVGHQLQSQVQGSWDLFISHASEDKITVARPLAHSLNARGLRVWIDEAELRIGDSLRRKIEEGLAHSRFGVVILSQSFFKKDWPQRELDGLSSRESTFGKVILPVWHDVDRAYVSQYAPILRIN
jgi:hypothetical protein